MSYDRVYNIFISHCWSYDHEYVRLVKLLDNASGFYWKNYSVSLDNPLAGGSEKKLVAEINGQIRLASAVLVVSGVEVAYRKWIKFEIDLADKYNKPIIGIIPRGGVNIPLAIRRSAWAVKRWSTVSIIRAIAENAR